MAFMETADIMLLIIQQLDAAFLRWSNEWVFMRSWWDVLIVFNVEFLGYWVLAGLLAFGVLALLPRFASFRRKNWEIIAVAFAAGLIARFGITDLIRAFYNQPRPFEIFPDLKQLVYHDGGGAFPSGHATFFFAVATVISRYYPKTSLLFWGAALSLSSARVAAGLHWPSDILGGAVIGIAVGLTTHWLVKKYLKPKPVA